MKETSVTDGDQVDTVPVRAFPTEQRFPIGGGRTVVQTAEDATDDADETDPVAAFCRDWRAYRGDWPARSSTR